MSPFETLIYFSKERESIRKLKEAGAPTPYSKDPIFQFRFTNVRRPFDRVSSWLINNVLMQKHIDYDLCSFLQFSAWCRTVNWPPTIKAVMDEGFYPKHRVDWRRLGKFIDQLGEKQKVWTGAFMVRASNVSGAKKGEYVSEVVVGKNLKAVLPELTGLLKTPDASYQAVWKLLQTVSGYGSFMAGQIAGDWTYTPLLGSAPDLETFAPMGPGSVRGYNRLLGIAPITKRPKEEDWLLHLGEWRKAIVEALGQSTRRLALWMHKIYVANWISI